MVSLIDLCWFFPVTGRYFLRESYCFDLEKTRPRYSYFSYMEPPGSQIPGHAAGNAYAGLYREHAGPRVGLCAMSRSGAESLADEAKFHGLYPTVNDFPGTQKILQESALFEGLAAEHRGVALAVLGTEDAGYGQMPKLAFRNNQQRPGRRARFAG